MSKAGGFIRPAFSLGQISKYVNDYAEEKEQKLIEVAKRLGEEFVNNARSIRTYQDRTGNLRSSIGYVVTVDGKKEQDNFEVSSKGYGNEKEAARAKAEAYADDLAAKSKQGILLTGVAGMEYAKWVERRGKDVITGSVPNATRVESLLNEIK